MGGETFKRRLVHSVASTTLRFIASLLTHLNIYKILNVYSILYYEYCPFSRDLRTTNARDQLRYLQCFNTVNYYVLKVLTQRLVFRW